MCLGQFLLFTPKKNSKHCSSDLFTKLVNLNPKGKTMAGKQISRSYLV